MKLGFGLSVVLLATSLAAQTTVRVSVGALGPPNGDSRFGDATPDGRFVLFESEASNLVPGDTNHHCDVFIRDRRDGTTERVSVTSTGGQPDADCHAGAVTPDGRWVTFWSWATNLVPGDTNRTTDMFVRDRWNHTTERVSLGTNGEQGNGFSGGRGSISADGRFVAFASEADNLVPGDTNQIIDVFVRDRWSGTTERVNTASNGEQGNADPFYFYLDGGCAMSADGRMVAFVSSSSNLVPNDTNGLPDVFVKDRLTGVTTRVSVSTNGTEELYDFVDVPPSCCISADGRYVGFNSQARNLVPGDTNGWFDGFVHDMRTGVTERVTVDSMGNESPWPYGSSLYALSADGRYAVFGASWQLLPGGRGGGHYDAYLRDRSAGTTERIGLGWNGQPPMLDCYDAWVSPDGGLVEFACPSDELTVEDTNGKVDVFLRDRSGGTEFEALCEPGVGGVIDCPCANPPSGSNRGCDNSSGLGGAVLSASGATSLSSDSLQFHVSRATTGGLSILFQGDALVAVGAVYGRGIRCVGGSVRRLFVEPSSAGTITMPEFSVGEESISTRSARKGDLIPPGQRRWYFVSYRDPIVSGNCTPADGFNASPTGRVAWSP